MDKPNPLKETLERLIQQGNETAAQEIALEYFEQQAALAAKAGMVANQTLDLADQMAADGDPHKQRVAAVLKRALVRSLDTMHEVASGQLSAEERRDALHEALPFSNSSSPSTTRLPDGEPSTSNGPLALEQEEIEEPQKPRRGRPPGSKNRSKPPEH